MADQAEVMNLSQAAAPPDRAGWLRPLANRNFRLMWIGENVSLAGDQFYFVALPWLVFQMTGSSVALGAILMIAGIPRALFMLIGGVLTDRFSPRAVMTVSNLLRLGITVLLTLIVAGQAIHLWMLYVIVFCFGSVDAFFHPAYKAIIPVIVDKNDLQASNALMLGTTQLTQVAGPGLAGMLVNLVGLALSFAFDALTFLFTSIMLLLMRPAALPERHAAAAPRKNSLRGEIADLAAYVRHDSTLPTIITVIAAVNFLFTGPLIVGSATLGRERFAGGSAAFGAMLSTFGVGMLIGTLVAGAVRAKKSGQIALMLLVTEGVFMIGIGCAPTLLAACVLWVLIGCGAGFANVHVITITQQRVSPDMLGRFMSVIALAEVGMAPMSNAFAGMLAHWSVTGLFVLAGGLLALVATLASFNPDLRASEA